MTDPSDDLTGDDEDGSAAAEIPFSVGDLVWAKTKSYPWWPGHVYDPSIASDDIKQARRLRHCALVAYFGDNDSCAWCEYTQLKPFVDEFHQMVQQKRRKSFLSAVAEAVKEIGKFLAKELDCSCFQLTGSREMQDEKNRPTQLRMPVSNYSPRDFLKRLHSVARDVSMGDELESAMLGSWVFAIERVSFSADSYEYCQRLKPAELVDDDKDPDEPPVYAMEEDRDTISEKLTISEDKVCQRSKRVSAARCIDNESFDTYGRLLCSSKGSDFDACERVLRRCSVTDESSLDKVMVDSSKVKISAGKKREDGSIEETMSSLGTATNPSNQGERKAEVALVVEASLDLHQNSADHGKRCPVRTTRCPVRMTANNGNIKGTMSGLGHVTNPSKHCERKTKLASVVETSLVLHQASADHYEQGKHWPVRTNRKIGNTKGTFSGFAIDETSCCKIVKTGLKRKTRKDGSPMKPLLHFNVRTRDKFDIGKLQNKKRKVRSRSNDTTVNCSEERESERKKMIRDEDCSGALDNVGCEIRYSKEAGETSQMTEHKNASTSGDMAALLLTFERDISLPSTDSLISTFSEYGHLVEVETLSMVEIGCARVLFTSSSDAEKAFNSRHKISAFDPAVRSYHLCR